MGERHVHANRVGRLPHPVRRGRRPGRGIRSSPSPAPRARDGWRPADAAGYRQSGPIDVATVAADPAASAYERVLADAGASVFRDSVDARVVAGVRDRTGKQIDSQVQVGGWPALPAGVAAVDTDGDGMPGAWERTHGLDPTARDGAALAKDAGGYTNLEIYLAEIAKVRR